MTAEEFELLPESDRKLELNTGVIAEVAMTRAIEIERPDGSTRLSGDDLLQAPTLLPGLSISPSLPSSPSSTKTSPHTR